MRASERSARLRAADAERTWRHTLRDFLFWVWQVATSFLIFVAALVIGDPDPSTNIDDGMFLACICLLTIPGVIGQVFLIAAGALHWPPLIAIAAVLPLWVGCACGDRNVAVVLALACLAAHLAVVVACAWTIVSRRLFRTSRP